MVALVSFFEDEYEFLSNAFHSPIEDSSSETVYDNVEEAYALAMYQFEDEILGLPSGNTPDYILEKIENKRYTIMLELVKQKFWVHKDLSEKLAQTGDAILLNGNMSHDNYWGSCFCSPCQNLASTNYLGQILEKVREDIIRQKQLETHYPSK